MLNSNLIKDLIRLAIQEDLGHGDVTSELCIDENALGSAEIVAREELVVAGLPLLGMIVSERGGFVRVETICPEGQIAKQEAVLARLSGSLRELLALERTILNFIQRSCGVATQARRYAEQFKPLMVLDTRKTIPGWRTLDKYACAVGGAKNHRANLAEMVIVKNNHVDAQAGKSPAERMRLALSKIYKSKPPNLDCEIEVRDLDELQAALEFKPQAIMLDNMDDRTIAKALRLIDESNFTPMVEVSGGVSLDRAAALIGLLAAPDKLAKDARSGDFRSVSVGALTTRARNVDISMRIIPEGTPLQPYAEREISA